MNDIPFFLELRTRIDSELARSIKAHKPNNLLLDAMRYSTLLGGKRVRPILTLATAKAFDCDLETALPAACAIELVHAYSLIHDDLPAMDDDDLRRGKPTCHVAYDEATAILAGDALQCLAFELLSQPESTLSAETQVQIIRTLSTASGAQGMVLGQAIDLQSAGKDITIETLEHMHRHKTGKLIEAAVLMGAHCGQASAAELNLLKYYAQALGLAFQVQDDILDVTGSTETLGKSSGADIALDKPTYVSLLGLESAKQKLNELLLECKNALEQLEGRDTTQLQQIAEYVVKRDK